MKKYQIIYADLTKIVLYDKLPYKGGIYEFI